MNLTHPLLDADGDKLREECGIFGVIGASEAAAACALGLHALQHRGLGRVETGLSCACRERHERRDRGGSDCERNQSFSHTPPLCRTDVGTVVLRWRKQKFE